MRVSVPCWPIRASSWNQISIGLSLACSGICALTVAATGARILTAVDFKNNRYNLFVVAISIGFGLIPLAAPTFFRNLPHDLQPLLESGILLCALVAVLLNAFFNGVGSKAAAEADAVAIASSAQHV